MTEKQFRSMIVRRLESLCAFPVENRVHDGAPDICTTVGWIELKLAQAPRDRRRTLRVDLRPAQRLWLHRWHVFGGAALVITAVRDPRSKFPPIWYAHSGEWASKHAGRCSDEDFRFFARRKWTEIPGPEMAVDVKLLMTGVKT